MGRFWRVGDGTTEAFGELESAIGDECILALRALEGKRVIKSVGSIRPAGEQCVFARSRELLTCSQNEGWKLGSCGSGPSFLLSAKLASHFNSNIQSHEKVHERHFWVIPAILAIMGTLSMPGRSSLDRLKALNDLPDLQSQLAEAEQLCSHSSRAEMILRWTMDKLKNSNAARTDDQAWDLLSSSLRLLPVQRIAALLGPSAIIEVLQLVASDKEHPWQSLSAITRTVNLLLELGGTTEGAPIKALFSINSEKAAPLCGGWFRLVADLSEGHCDFLSILNEEALLDPAIHIWTFHKRQASVDSFFNEKCLVPVSRLIALLEGESGCGHDSLKRKHGRNEPNSSYSYERAMEAFFIRHTILPARTAFFRKHRLHADPNHGPESKPADQILRENLQTLNDDLADDHKCQCVRSMPLLLEIALRANPTTNFKDRARERPWIEVLFTALNDCFRSIPHWVYYIQTLTESLEMVHRYGSLSSQFIATLARKDASLSDHEEDNGRMDWDLIAILVDLDANVFASQALTDKLFEVITTEQASEDPELYSREDWVKRFAPRRDEIVIPILNAYVQRRSLNEFFDLWSKQLQKTAYAHCSSFWSDLGSSVTQVLEANLTFSQNVQLFDRLITTIATLSVAVQRGADQNELCELYASLDLLNAMLGAINNAEPLDNAQKKLELITESVARIFEADLTDLPNFLYTALWSSLTKVLQLSLPLWIAKQTDPNIVEKRLRALLQGNACMSASACCDVPLQAQKSSEKDKQSLQAALSLVAVVCEALQNLDGSSLDRTILLDVVNRIGTNRTAGLRTLLKHPNLFAILSPDTLDSLLSNAIKREIGGDDGIVHATLSVALNGSQDHLLKEIVRLVLSCLAGHGGNISDDDDAENFAVRILASIPVGSLAEAQRGSILNGLTAMPNIATGRHWGSQFCRRLALILKLCELPCQTSRLYMDLAILQGLAAFANDCELFKTEPGRESLVDPGKLIEEITRRLACGWLDLRNGENDRRMLAAFSAHIKWLVESTASSSQSAFNDQSGHLGIVKVAMEMTQGASHKDATLIQQEPEIVRLYGTTLAAEVESLLSNTSMQTSEQGQPTARLCRALEALIKMCASSSAGSNIDKKKLNQDVSKAVSQLDVAHLQQAFTPAAGKTAFLLKFQFACKRAESIDEDFIKLASTLLKQKLDAPEQHMVLMNFAEALKRIHGSEKVNVLQHLLSRTSVPFLLLQQIAIKALSKTDFGPDSKISASMPLIQTLEAVVKGESLQARCIALHSTIIILKDKSFMVSQNGVESTISTMHQLAVSRVHLVAFYNDICQTVSMILAHHRSRIKGRFHLLVALFQELLSCLFVSSKSMDSKKPLGVRQAHSFARLLVQLCNRPRVRSRGKTSELVDEARKAQAHTGQYVQYILHHYCVQILSQSLAEGMRETLAPGLWAVIEAIETDNADGIKTLSAAMNNSERAVLRSVYDDWKNLGKWEGL